MRAKGGKTKGVELRCLIVGGNANNGGNAGLFNFNSNNSLSNSNANIGARLNYYTARTLQPSPKPMGRTGFQPQPLGEKISTAIKHLSSRHNERVRQPK